MESIRKEVVVAASQETAFIVFTDKIDLWWPSTHHVGSCPMTGSVIEPYGKGRWYSKHEDGSEVNVGYVQTWDPYGRLVLIWQIDGNFKCDPNLISEVEICFIAEGPVTTRVTLEHRDLEQLRGGTKVIDDMDKGWEFIMNLYKSTANSYSEVPA